MVFVALGLFSPTLPKASEVDDKNAGTTPVPVSAAICGLLEAASFTVSVPVSAPRMLGVSVTVMVQWPLAARLVPQVLLSVKSGLPVVMLEIVSATASLL